MQNTCLYKYPSVTDRESGHEEAKGEQWNKKVAHEPEGKQTDKSLHQEPDIAQVQMKQQEQEQEKQEQEQRVDPAAAQKPERGRSQITVGRHRANVRQMWDSKFPWIQNLRKRGWSMNHRKKNKT